MKPLRHLRRRWCMWRGHPMADWSPIVRYVPGRFTAVGEVITDGPEIIVRQWRCALHETAHQ